MYNNDYEKLIKSYLRNYIQWSTYTENLKRRIEDIEARMRLPAAPKTTRFTYDRGGSGGWDKPSPEEAHCIKREEDEALIIKLKKEYLSYRPVIECIDACLDQLTATERDVVEKKGIDNESWAAVAQRNNMSESSCRLCFRRAVKKMTGMYFGPKAYPEEGSLFLPGGNIYISLDNEKKYVHRD